MEKEIKTKVCTKCREEKPATPEFFFRNKITVDGFHCSCKYCYKKWMEQRLNYKEKKYSEISLYKASRYKKRYNNEYLKERQEKSKDGRKEYKKKSRQNLSREYVTKILNNNYNIPIPEMPAEFIEMKRKQLKYYRELKQLKEELK